MPDTLSVLLCILCASAVNLFAAEPSREGAFLPPEAAAPSPALPFTPKPGDPAVLKGKGVVRWRAWNADAFAEAARVRKPILLFVTANWCHWGKVMDRVTFTDMEVATRLNEQFVPVRLDRDEHPDVDVRLQQAVQAVSGRRGWPLTAALTPEGRVFLGGTFFPAEDDPTSERPGLRGLITQAVRAWRDQQPELLGQAQKLDDTLRKAAEEEDTAGEAPTDILERVARATTELADSKAGGIFSPGESAGKFPTPRALDLCLTHYARSRDAASLDVVRKALDGMLRGCVYDHLAGGFHRCSADRWWRVPRFEKLLVPNAELLALCLHAWQATGDVRYKQAVEQTLAFWTSMQDADSAYFPGSIAGGTTDLDEGHYYTWTVKEIESVLRDDADCRFAREYFGIGETDPSRARQQAVPSPFRSVLCAPMSSTETPERLQRVRNLLLQARSQRPAPAVDRRSYVDANALMAAAFIECGQALGAQPHLARGLKTLRALLKDGVKESEPRASASGANKVSALHVLQSAGPQPLANDEAALAYACAIAYGATQEKEFLDAGEAALRRLYQNFWDKEDGGYFDRATTAHGAIAGLAWNTKVYQDTEQPATNALVALACVRFGELTNRKEFTDRAASIVNAFGATLEQLGPYGATLTIAADAVQHGPLPQAERK